MISMSISHSLSFSSLQHITNTVYYESFQNCILEIVSGKKLKSLVSWWLWCLWHILQPLTLYDTNRITSPPLRSRPYNSESLQLSFCQNLLEAHQAGCFTLMVMSVGHSLSFSSPRRRTNSHHHVFRKLALFNSWRKQLKWLLTRWL